MRRLFNLKTGRTQIVQLMSGRSAAELIGEARNGMADGADGIAVNLCDLDLAERNAEVFRQILDAVPLPFMFIHYRQDSRMTPQDDEPRQTELLAAAEAGVGMIDVMGDLFDKSPDERTRNPEAIAKQKALIKQIHGIGAQVVISSHPLRFMNAEAIVEQLKDFESRGADLVKIVTTADTEAEYLENIRATMLAWHEIAIPFTHLCGGRFSRLQRFSGAALGCSITFAVQRYVNTNYFQPTIREFRAFQNSVLWNINNAIEK